MTSGSRPCKRCKGEIPEERWLAMKASGGTELCVTCSEATDGEFNHSHQQERTSKEGSLKISYGGVADRTRVRRDRNWHDDACRE